MNLDSDEEEKKTGTVSASNTNTTPSSPYVEIDDDKLLYRMS